MSTFKKCKVVMLSTNRKANIKLNTTANKLFISDSSISNSSCKAQHLYITSDDEIKKDDWYYYQHFDEHIICSVDKSLKDGTNTLENLNLKDRYYKKIIATTDNSLGYTDHRISPVANFCDYPQPSQSFIEKYVEEYNKGNVITDVLVEYEKHFDEDWSDISGAFEIEYETLKVSKDNTITIRRVKDSWSRDEVKLLINSFADYHNIHWLNNKTHKWIEENL